VPAVACAAPLILLTDIRDEAVHLSQLLTTVFPASRATVHETRSCRTGAIRADLPRQIGPGALAAINVGKKSR
jgi:hypothetical protein